MMKWWGGGWWCDDIVTDIGMFIVVGCFAAVGHNIVNWVIIMGGVRFQNCRTQMAILK